MSSFVWIVYVQVKDQKKVKHLEEEEEEEEEEGQDRSQGNKGLVSQRNVTRVVELTITGKLLPIEKETEEWQAHLLDKWTLNVRKA